MWLLAAVPESSILPSRSSLTGWPARWLAIGAAVVCLLAFSKAAQQTYLYFVSLCFVGAACGFLHSLVFANHRWGDPWEARDAEPKAHWRENAPTFLRTVLVTGAVVAVIWAVLQLRGVDTVKSGGWYLFYVAVFAPFIYFSWPRLRYLNFRATVPTVLTMTLVLGAYEYLLLREETGWAYNGTVVAYVFVVPLENVIFIYPVAAALVCVLYAIVTRYLNDLKAFWLLMGGLTCVFVPVELVGIGLFDLWDVEQFRDKSVLPF